MRVFRKLFLNTGAMQKPLFWTFFLFMPAICLFAQADVQLRFEAPAVHFTQSLPLGNGRLGAMVFGGTATERIVLNEISMWSGGTEDPNRPDAHRYLPAIQTLLSEEKNKEAQDLLQQHFVAAGKGSGHGNGKKEKFGCYQTLGDLFIRWHDTTGAVSDYHRILQIDSARATTTWKRNGVTYKEEVFVSAPQQVLVVRLSSNKPKALSFDVALSRKEQAVFSSDSHALTMTGQLDGGNGESGIRFAGYVKALSPDGKITASNKGLQVQNASECTLIVSAATDLNWPQVETRGAAPLPVAKAFVEQAATLSWARLLQNHSADFGAYFNRCRIYFTAEKTDALPALSTPQRLQRYASGKSDAALPALYFNFGRYLLISASRPGGLPANLQGLWAEEYQTPWNGDYHLNINLQMNYWPAEITNLAGCHLPLIEFTRQLVQPGEKTATAYYNTRGWVAHMMSNPWKFTAPGESASWGSSLTGGAWLCAHLWQHYLYNPDKTYLQSIYPVLKGAAQFFCGILIKDPQTGWLVTAPSNSPENTYITASGFQGQTTLGPTMDMQIGRELLGNTLKAARILGVDKAWRDSLQRIRTQLAPNQISPSTGGIQEWLRDYGEAEPRHRHVSHLYGLFPYDEINAQETPLLTAAARKTLERRGNEGTGWSRAWKMNFWARLGDGNRALAVFNGLLQPAFAPDSLYQRRGAGSYPNLFCAHPPFQIDGNFGGTAAIAAMLLQSTGKNNVIRILPALPTAAAWQSGEAEGLCAANGFELDFCWKEGRLQQAVISSKAGLACYVQVPEGMQVYTAKGKKVRLQQQGSGVAAFSTRKNETYFLK